MGEDEEASSDCCAQSDRPLRTVLCFDSLQWLDTLPDGGFGEDTSVFTSLPDVHELCDLFRKYMFKEYKVWFVDTLSKVMAKIRPGGYCIVMQSDGRLQYTDHGMFEWLDKGHLACLAAEQSDMTLVWHKLVLCNKSLDRRSSGKPSFSHMLCFAKNGCRGLCATIEHKNVMSKALALPCGCPPVTHRGSHFSIPDIFHRGEMLWVRGIGLDCCYAGVMFLRDVGKAKKVVDPFAGVGTVLAMANALGMEALGVEISAKRCRKARNIRVEEEHLSRISPLVRRIAVNEEAEREARRRVEREGQDRERDHDAGDGGDPDMGPASNGESDGESDDGRP